MLEIATVLLASVSIAGCATFSDCVQGSGEPTTQGRELTTFNGITIEGSMDVVIQQGPTQSVQVVAQENLLPLITTTVADNHLTIGSKECYSTKKGVRLLITIPDYNTLRIEGSGSFVSEGTITSDALTLGINGSGNMNLDLAINDLRSEIDGSGDMDLKGKAAGHVVSINGSGDVHGLELLTERCGIEINGSGDCDVNVASSLDVEINGVGDVRYKGAVKDVRQNVNGIGDVERIQ